MSYPHRYTVTVKDATPGQFNLIAKDFCDYYKETFSNDNIIVVEDERSMYFEDIGNERFIGFENCPAEALSRGFPEFEIEWRRLYAGINDNLNMYINDHLRMYTSDYALI